MLKKLAMAVTAASTMGMSAFAVSETVPSPIGDFDVSMTATLATDYIWRGQSQTQGKAAVQASLDVGHESGVYAGIWASNVDADVFGGASIEVDYYVGYGNDINEVLSYDLSWNLYTYPGGVGNIEEWIGSLSAYGLTGGVKYAYHPESSLYKFISYAHELPYDTGVILAFGHTDVKDYLLDRRHGETYTDWSLTLAKTFATVDFALMYSDTNLSNSVCRDWYLDRTSSCGSNWTFSASKAF